MPAGDGTGPMGMGPMTGRAAGCVPHGRFWGAGQSRCLAMMPGRGFGMGFGRGGGRGRGMGGGGFGRRNMFYATGMTGWQRGAYAAPGWGAYPAGGMPYAGAPTREQQLDSLKGQAEYFEDTLGGLRKRIEELESETAKK